MKAGIKKPYGICPASMTIWNEDQSYNKQGMERYLRWLLDNGARIQVTNAQLSRVLEQRQAILEALASGFKTILLDLTPRQPSR